MSMVLEIPFTKNIDEELLTIDAVAIKYKSLVHSIAGKHKKRAKQAGIDYEDIASEGNIGLIKAYKGFKSELGFKFMTYAYSMIEGEVKRRIRDSNSGAKFSRRIKELAVLVEIEDNPHEIAIKLNINILDAQEVWACKHQSGTISIDVTLNQNEDKDMTMQDYIPFHDDFTSVFVNEFIKELEEENPRFSLIVQLLLEGKNQAEIGKIVGVSQVQVSRNINKIRDFYRGCC
ncbi:sigma-70 family RNA polymerase sigma factor [Peribacillus frigoritolerans]|uniref:sigma-70 family RNA polymerase sigma factor n=1 Tax=Peribacillus frigoritolerans TaxID=450367 RepID=UPI003CFE8C5C